MKRALLFIPLLLGFPALAQESASYRLNEHVFNAGGNPVDGVVLVSTNYRVTLDAIGDAVASRNLSSVSYRMDGGFATAYPPPGEVRGLFFADQDSLVWSPEPSAGAYNLYRDLMRNLTGLGYGACEQQAIAAATTNDTAEPPMGDGYFYLVTVENRLEEEGTKGFDSLSIERQGTVCP